MELLTFLFPLFFPPFLLPTLPSSKMPAKNSADILCVTVNLTAFSPAGRSTQHMVSEAIRLLIHYLLSVLVVQ